MKNMKPRQQPADSTVVAARRFEQVYENEQGHKLFDYGCRIYGINVLITE